MEPTECLGLEGVPSAGFPTVDRLRHSRNVATRIDRLYRRWSVIDRRAKAREQYAHRCAGETAKDDRCSAALPDDEDGRAPVLPEETEGGSATGPEEAEGGSAAA
jgi:hypothetical protein